MMAINEHQLYNVALSLIPGIGQSLSKQIITHLGSSKQAFNVSHSRLLKIPGFGQKIVSRISNEYVRLAEQELKKAESSQTRIIHFTDPDFSTRLNDTPDAPSLIYHRGNSSLNHDKMVAIVGTRDATNYGKEMTKKIIADLAIYKPVIVSGLALGIDAAAHFSALDMGMITIGVLGSGVDVIYPAIHKKLGNKLLESGCLISENKLGTKPDATRFPARNRIIAGMSDAVIVVESADKGGSLITAEIAHSYQKDVMAVPGRVSDLRSVGCNRLIKSLKATMITSGHDLVSQLNWDLQEGAKQASSKRTPLCEEDFTSEEWQVIKVLKLKRDKLLIDELSFNSGIQLNKLAGVLLQLEFKGILYQLPGKFFKLNNS